MEKGILFVLAAFAFIQVQASVREEWRDYKLSYDKQYSAKEEAFRFSVWESNRKMVEDHNSGDHDWRMSVNEFSDWTKEEFEEKMLGYNPMANQTGEGRHFMTISGAPDHLDYRELGMVNPIQNQGMCGAAGIFSAVAAIEGMWKAKKGTLYKLSEAQLVACDPNCHGGCNGGWMADAFETAKKGVQESKTYPGGFDCDCQFDPDKAVAHTTGSENVKSSESVLESALSTVGYPISVAVHVGASFQHYMGGVFSDPECQYGQLNHAMLLVGYDKSGSTPYWILRNSWGPSWGEQGYMRVKMGENTCGLSNAAIYPIVD